MSLVWRKIGLLYWKNMKVLQRHWIMALFEVLIPFMLFALLSWIHTTGSPSTEDNVVKTPTLFPKISVEDFMFPNLQVQLYFTPNNTVTLALMKQVQKKLKFNNKRMTPFSTENDMENHMTANYDLLKESGDKPFGVVFSNLEKNVLPKNLNYKIRAASAEWRTDLLYPYYQTNGPMSIAAIYNESGFMALQHAVDNAFTNMTNSKINPNSTSLINQFTVQQFPYPPHIQDSGGSMVTGQVVAISSVFAFFILCLNIVGRIVEDKHTGVTELMKLMGLSRWMMWLTWYMRVLMDNLVIITIMVIFLKLSYSDDVGAIFEKTDGFLIWVFLLLFSFSVATFVFAVSTFFSRPVFAMCFGTVIWLMSYFIPVFAMKSSTKFYAKMILSLMPNVAMHLGFSIIHTFELRYVGVSWSNLKKSPSGSPDDVNMGHVFMMLIIDIFIYGIITCYVDAVKPGKYGVPEPMHFCFTRSFWGLNRDNSPRPTSNLLGPKESFEPPSQGLSVGIKIQDLRKKYRSGKVAVDGVTLDIYEAQITALLGHNGAGKTTTMSIITGMLPSTSGSVWINNYNIRTDLAKVRESLGLCPQHNMLFSDLTVIEHLMFFGMLKGMTKHSAKKEGKALLKSMKLDKKSRCTASQLSGGMQRKLSLGIALIGGSKVVILDEPTSGLDPQSRRHIWDMLLGMRGQRTIVITTHFMEEADVLGDRIAIMDHGRVQCYGTSLFLKRQYGAGYVLKLLTQEFCSVSKITSVVQGAVHGSKLKSRLGSELSYSLPAELTSAFPALFGELEKEKATLGISSIGVSLTTLEDVFLNVGNQAATATEDDVALNQRKLVSPQPSTPSGLITDSHEYKRPKATGLALLNLQIEALIVKRIIAVKRKLFMFLVLAMVAILLVFAAFERGLASIKAVDSAVSGRRLSLDEYEPSEVFYSDVQSSVVREYRGIIAATESKARAIMPPERVSEALLREGEADLSKFRSDFIVAAEFDLKTDTLDVSAMYSGLSYHDAPISLNLVNNAVLRSYVNSKEYSITTVNHPFEMQKEVQREAKVIFVGLIWQILMPVGLLFMMANFLMFPLLERISSAKQLQYMTGVQPPTYWFTCFFLDMLMYTIVGAIMVGLWPAIDWSGHYGGMKEMGVFALILFMYGLGCIPYAYCYSYLMKTGSSAIAIFVSTNFVIGCILPFIIVIIEDAMRGPDHEPGFDVVVAIKKMLYLLPHFTLTIILLNFSQHAVSTNLCASMDKDYKAHLCASNQADHCCQDLPDTMHYLSIDSDTNPLGIGLPLIMLGVDCIVYLAIVFLLDYGVVSRLGEKLKRLRLWPSKPSQDEVDADVKMEMDRVETSDSNVLTVTDMMKAYSRDVVAVQGVTFGVMPGECFGLLGVNGAGKTTTFKMLTGAEIPTHGDARIDNFSLSKDKAQYLSQIGYCPQFDAINESLTGREILQLFARLRGIHKADVNSVVQKWLTVMGLEEYQDALSGTYSGGNKRKLSTAMALVGEPPLIFLDEPTSGVDPVARRNLWSVLAKIQTRNRSIVLTSHSMEECEALCNRLAIMVQGQFVCIGETQHLKQKFGQGFTIMIKLKDVEEHEEQSANVMRVFDEAFPACVLKDKHTGLLHYHLTDPRLAWRTLFFKMEEMKAKNVAIEDYTISETTLEQVFLSFALKQK